jgi:hypothetical protein
MKWNLRAKKRLIIGTAFIGYRTVRTITPLSLVLPTLSSETEDAPKRVSPVGLGSNRERFILRVRRLTSIARHCITVKVYSS